MNTFKPLLLLNQLISNYLSNLKWHANFLYLKGCLSSQEYLMFLGFDESQILTNKTTNWHPCQAEYAIFNAKRECECQSGRL